MIRATLDVNVLVSGFQGTAGSPTALINAWIDARFELVLSEHILGAWSEPGESRTSNVKCRKATEISHW